MDKVLFFLVRDIRSGLFTYRWFHLLQYLFYWLFPKSNFSKKLETVHWKCNMHWQAFQRAKKSCYLGVYRKLLLKRKTQWKYLWCYSVYGFDHKFLIYLTNNFLFKTERFLLLFLWTAYEAVYDLGFWLK